LTQMRMKRSLPSLLKFQKIYKTSTRANFQMTRTTPGMMPSRKQNVTSTRMVSKSIARGSLSLTYLSSRLTTPVMTITMVS
jgi:SMC interacting uncharacterized protein involved in chromosome segregation